MSGPVQFGKYGLLRKIATGGMAEIFLAKQSGLEGIERFVVIKRVLPHMTESGEFVRMFVDEMRIAAFLSHPNIVQIYDIGAVGDLYYIAMEYLEGRDLRRIMRKAAARGEVVPLGFALRVVSEVCEGLYYAHNRHDNLGKPLNLIHRDISPQNVMATIQGAVKLLDFGIAKAESQLNETRSGVLKGKYSYMSPEQAMGRQLDFRSDIFALGTILYELTTGRRLFKHENEIVVLKMVAEADVPPPRIIDPGFPPELERIIMKALSRDPDLRYLSARELQQDIGDFSIPMRLMMSVGQVGEYVATIFADERDDINPSSIPPQPTEDFVVSFMESSQTSALNTPSFPSLLEQNAAAYEEKSATGSLSVLVQRARRRPLLTLGLGTGFAALVLATVLFLSLGLGEATIEQPVPLNPLISGKATSDLGDSAIEVVSFGTIAVESTPRGAKIFIDNEEQDEQAPMTINAITVGDQHFIVAEMEGKTPQARRITLDRDGDFKTVRFNFEREETPAVVEFDGLPEDATVEIDGQGRSPGNYNLQPSVQHSIVVRRRSEELARQEVTPRPGQVVSVRVRRSRTSPPRNQGGDRTTKVQGKATLSVNSQPPTTVYVGRTKLGSSPVTAEIEAGNHTLRLVNRSLMINYTESLKVRAGQRIQRNITIGRGKVRVSARPFADVTINGVNVGRTPVLKTLYSGTYTIVLANAKLEKRERRVVRLKSGGDERVGVDWR